MRLIPLFAAKPENLANRYGNHEFFIGADHADRYPASRGALACMVDSPWVC
jgi:hypothetical protein